MNGGTHFSYGWKAFTHPIIFYEGEGDMDESSLSLEIQ